MVSELPLGTLALAELERSIRTSRLTVVVVSQAFVADVWSRHAELLASHEAMARGAGVIPILLDDCAPPLRLAAAVSLDLRARERWEPELGKLRRLLPEPRDDGRGEGSAPGGERDDGEAILCPYPGMRPFRRDEEKRFFGRQREIDQVVQLLRAGERELYVLGPSGSGKSSLISVGVLPLIERDAAQGRFGLPRMEIRSLRPGDHPAARLAEVLGGGVEAEVGTEVGAEALAGTVGALLAASGAAQLLLFVDQLEELFTVAGTDERGRFVAQLLALRADPRCRLLFGVRADFFGALIDSPLWTDGKTLHVAVAPLRGEALRAAISSPARDAGVYFEPGLVERLMADADAEPGILPLLQETLVQLWGRRQRRVLSLAAYEELGSGGRHGLAVAIARHADACVRALSREQEACARRILLRLVAFGEGMADTRRQQLRRALAEGAEPRLFGATLEALAQSRLVTLDSCAAEESRVDLAHEALLWAWPTLAGWVAARRKEEAQRRGLVAKVAEWQARREEDPTAGLLDVLELRDAEAWLGSESARDLGEVSGLAELARHSRAQRNEIIHQRDEARRLLGAMYLESGRQLLLDDHPQRAIPYLVAAREEAGPSPALQMLFHSATRVVVAATMGHRAEVCSVAFCPRGVRIATGSADGTARVWDAATGQPLTPPLAHEAPVKQVAFSPDGRRLVTASSDYTAQVWDVVDGVRLLPPLRHTSSVWKALFSADGTRLLTASLDRTARVWSAATGEPISPPLVHQDWVVDAGFSADGRRVVTASDDGSARIWDAESGELVAPLLLHDGEVECAGFSPDGTRVVTSGGKAARLWDAASGEELLVLRHGAPVVTAVFAPDGKTIATGSADRTARIWDVASGAPCTPPLLHGAAVEQVAFSSCGGFLVSGSVDRTARVWDVVQGKPAAAPLEHGQPVLDVAFSSDGRRIVTCSADRTARLWERAAPAGRLPRLDHGRPVRSAAFSPDGMRLVTVSRGQHVLVWDLEEGVPISPRLKHDRPVRSAVFSPDGTRIATASWDQTARVWDARTGAQCAPRLAHRGGVEQVAFRGDGAQLVTAATDRLARTWDLATGQLVRSFGPHGGPVLDAAFSPDGAWVLTACDDGIARIWDAASGELVAASLLHGGAVLSAAFSPDGQLVVTASADGTARVWEAASGKAVGPPMEHGAAVHRAMFSGEGARIVTASADKTARIWDASSGRPLAPPMEHGERVLCAAFSPDGQRVVTASHDHTAQVWDVARDERPLAEWQAVAKRCSYLLASDHHGPALGAAIGTVVGAAIGAVVAAGENARAAGRLGGGEPEPERGLLDERPELHELHELHERAAVEGRPPERRGLRGGAGLDSGRMHRVAAARAELEAEGVGAACERCGQLPGDAPPSPMSRSNAVADALALAVEELARCVEARATYQAESEAALMSEDDDMRATG
jgi:WD40 repeat protein